MKLDSITADYISFIIFK